MTIKLSDAAKYDKQLPHQLAAWNWLQEQLTKEQVHWVLKDEGYSEREIDNAISDYYSIHIRSDIMLHHYIAPVVLLIVMLALILQLYQLIIQD